jgi:hypothetical protein
LGGFPQKHPSLIPNGAPFSFNDGLSNNKNTPNHEPNNNHTNHSEFSFAKTYTFPTQNKVPTSSMSEEGAINLTNNNNPNSFTVNGLNGSTSKECD